MRRGFISSRFGYRIYSQIISGLVYYTKKLSQILHKETLPAKLNWNMLHSPFHYFFSLALVLIEDLLPVQVELPPLWGQPNNESYYG